MAERFCVVGYVSTLGPIIVEVRYGTYVDPAQAATATSPDPAQAPDATNAP
jgi:hypothetical protein